MAEFVFGIVAVSGLVAAKRPQAFVKYFLADWQRERIASNLAAVSWTGWIVFGCATFTIIAMLVIEAGRR